jgi:hypothetical protein
MNQKVKRQSSIIFECQDDACHTQMPREEKGCSLGNNQAFGSESRISGPQWLLSCNNGSCATFPKPRDWNCSIHYRYLEIARIRTMILLSVLDEPSAYR